MNAYDPIDPAEIEARVELGAKVWRGLRDIDKRAVLADLEATLRETDDLLRRLAEWDMLSTSLQGVPATADAPYWQREIAAARTALAKVLL